MDKLQPNIELAKKKLLKNKDIFLKNNLKLIEGQSIKVRKLARKGLASLGSVEVSAKFRDEVVRQSRILCEDYIYNRLAKVLHTQQKRVFHQERTEQSASVDEGDDEMKRQIMECNPFKKQQSQVIDREAEDDDIYCKSSPDKVGQARYEKWRNRLPEVSAKIQEMGSRLETTYPHLYDNLPQQLKMPLRSEASINKALTCIGDFMFKNSSITWYRVVALFAVVGAMALEAIDRDNGKLIKSMIMIFSQVVDRHVALWVCNQGGWASLVRKYEPATETYMFMVSILGFILSFAICLALPVTFL